MLEDLDNLAARVQQLVQLAESARAENNAIVQRAEAQRQALLEKVEADQRALAIRTEAEHRTLNERLARCEAENLQLRNMLITARDRVDSVLARIPDPDPIVNEAEQNPHGTA